MSGEAIIRLSVDADGDALSRLIARCWADYPGSYFDRHGEMAMLDAIATYYAGQSGTHWSVVPTHTAHTQGARIIGCLGAAPGSFTGEAPWDKGDTLWEMTKLYVSPTQRRGGFAGRLVQRAEDYARAHGADRMILWTDTRFIAAHRFYENRGYISDGRTRTLGDLSQSVEYLYSKRVAPPL